ncbi:hypothetical protein RSOLAG22IIIB_10351 [Rhizoctonia solani]|uniref:F-box domain-containing protein n=1 Tax=Rhizoctonia solani TaxID=456999 RepID=A0A0K6G3C4_9AGAM|nr:hypothetical protein RSOLAG22IIIB_10351 [Rhizoctonia solani]
MPPEVFNEITTHLLPMDLLSLARSNKFFRTMFMSRTSLHLWLQALANAPEIPSCPPDLNEPQYTSLLFSKTCSSCGTRVLRRMDPFLHVRLCNPCRDEQTMEFSVHNGLLQFLPQSQEIKDTRDGITYTLESDFSKIRNKAIDDMDEDTFIEWQKAKYDEVCKRHDHVWANLRPKPVGLIESNRAYHGPAETEKRRRERIDKLHALVSDLKEALPLLVRFELKPSLYTINSDGYVKPRSSFPDCCSPGWDYLVDEIKQPFPTMAEFLMWPMIERLVGEETPLEDVETNFGAIRDEFDQAVGPSESRRLAKGKGNSENPGSRHIQLALPEFVATYTKPDGSTTMDISDLSANLQLLLRADTIFRSTRLLRTYPGIVPSGFPHEYFVRRSTSVIAKEFLALVGQSEESSVHMKALGGQFKYGRCDRAPVDSWEDLIRHCTIEQGRWRKAQEKIKAETKSGFVFNSTHELEPANTKPFAHLMAGNTAIEYMEKRDIFEIVPVKCMRYENMGISARFSHSDVLSNSLIEEHLRSVHDVEVVRVGVNFRECDIGSDEGSEDTEE